MQNSLADNEKYVNVVIRDQNLGARGVLSRAKLVHCTLVNCKFENIRFSKCLFSNCSFIDCFLDNATFESDTILRNCKCIRCNIPNLHLHLQSESDMMFSEPNFAENVKIECEGDRIPLYRDLDNFFIQETFEGGEAKTYVVIPRHATSHFQLGNRYVVRLIHCADVSRSPQLRKECENLSKVISPYVVRLIRTYERRKRFYMAMEYAPGCTLWRLMDHSHSLAPEAKKSLCIQAFTALRDIHEKGIVHRDINPKNFIVNFLNTKETEINLKLIDFGFSKDIAANSPNTLSQPFFPPGYCPPELLANGLYDFRSEQFSLAVMLYQIWTGEHPFMKGNVTPSKVNYERALTNGFPVDFALIGEQPFQYVLEKCLKRDPEERFTNMNEIVNALITNKYDR